MNELAAVVLVLASISLAFGLAVFRSTLRRMEATLNRMENATLTVASDLAGTAKALRVAAQQRAAVAETLGRMEDAAVVVADNLASSVGRADATIGPDGAAADAALRTGDTPEAITARQDEARG